MSNDTALQNLYNMPTVSAEREGDVAGEMRKRNEPSAAESAENEGNDKSLRQRYLEARKAMDVKSRATDYAKEKISSAIGNPGREVTAMWMRGCWWSLIPSFGYSIFLLDAMVFLNKVLGDEMICPLGHEWVPTAVLRANPEEAKKMAGKFALIEIVIFLIVNFLMGAVILAGLGLIALVVDFATMSWWKLAETIYSLGFSGVQALIDILKGLL